MLKWKKENKHNNNKLEKMKEKHNINICVI